MTGPTLCRVCESTLEPFDEGMILGRIRAQYYRCPACGLVALPSPTWLEEAYDVNGPWTRVSGVSPAFVSQTNAAAFYRLRR